MVIDGEADPIAVIREVDAIIKPDESKASSEPKKESPNLHFRCKRCSRSAHYEHCECFL